MRHMRQNSKGFSLVSILVGLAIMSFVFIGLSQLNSASASAVIKYTDHADLRDLRLYLSNVTNCYETTSLQPVCTQQVALHSADQMVVPSTGRQIGKWQVKAVCQQNQIFVLVSKNGQNFRSLYPNTMPFHCSY